MPIYFPIRYSTPPPEPSDPPDDPFPLNEWVNITPPGITPGSTSSMLMQGVTYDANQPGTIYVCNGPFADGVGGLYKTIDWGENWTLIGDVTGSHVGSGNRIDNPLHLRVDPNDSDHLYAVQGVRGGAFGFYRSFDGGETFSQPAGIASAAAAASIPGYYDGYDIEVDPEDFDTVLMSFHGGFGGAYGGNSGLMRSTDGGDTWEVLPPESTWGTGHSIRILRHPGLDIGSSSRYLLGTQTDGMWLSTDAGAGWTKVVSDAVIFHGGCQAYYTPAGVLHVGGDPNTLKSSDNGATWTAAYSGKAWSVYGDGDYLYTGPGFQLDSLQRATVESGTSFSDVDAQEFASGPFWQQFDPATGILLCSMLEDGLWARRVKAPA